MNTRGKLGVMASIDYDDRHECQTGPRLDGIGLSFFIAHLAIGGYVLFGWIVSPEPALVVYLLLLPTMATQWYVNQGSCVVNNIESWLRSGHWRDPSNPEEGGFLLMLCHWFFRVRPHPVVLDRFSYAAVL